MCYYGHAENTSNLGGDVAWSFFFGALVEIPAYSVPFLINREIDRPNTSSGYKMKQLGYP